MDVSALYEAGLYKDALALVKQQCKDTLFITEDAQNFLMKVTETRPSILTQLNQDADAGDCVAMFLFGFCSRQTKYVNLAAAKGYPLAIYYRGWLKMCQHTDVQTAYDDWVLSASLGCPRAMWSVGYALCNPPPMVNVMRDIKAGAMWLSRSYDLNKESGAINALKRELNSRPFECTQFGVWEPTITCHRLTEKGIRARVFQWLLISKRKRLNPYISVLVTSFIVTE